VRFRSFRTKDGKSYAWSECAADSFSPGVENKSLGECWSGYAVLRYDSEALAMGSDFLMVIDGCVEKRKNENNG
jgi:hypothetical protein